MTLVIERTLSLEYPQHISWLINKECLFYVLTHARHCNFVPMNTITSMYMYSQRSGSSVDPDQLASQLASEKPADLGSKLLSKQDTSMVSMIRVNLTQTCIHLLITIFIN